MQSVGKQHTVTPKSQCILGWLVSNKFLSKLMEANFLEQSDSPSMHLRTEFGLSTEML